MQKHNIGLPFERTAVDKPGLLPVIEEGNKYTKKVKGCGDGLREMLSCVHGLLRHKNSVEDRTKTRYDLKDTSIGFQAGDLV